MTGPVVLSERPESPGKGVRRIAIAVGIECGKTRAFRQKSATRNAVAKRRITPLQKCDHRGNRALVIRKVLQKMLHAWTALFGCKFLGHLMNLLQAMRR